GGGITFYDYETGKVEGQVAFDCGIVHLVPLSSTEALGCGVINHNHASERMAPRAKASRETLNMLAQNVTYSPAPLCYARVDGKKAFFQDESEPGLFLFNFALAPLSGTDVFVSTHMASDKILL